MQRYATTLSGRTVEWIHATQQLGAFVMAPFCSRIRDGEFTYKDAGRVQQVRLPPNADDQVMHGYAWQAEWQPVEQTEAMVRLRYDHAAGDWPWAFQVEQRIELQGDDLVVAVALRNQSTCSHMPAGFGWHPFFSRTTRMTVQGQVGGWWRLGPDLLPLAHEPLPAELNMAEGLAVDQQALDHVFTGCVYPVRLSWPEWRASLAIHADPVFRHLVVYAPADATFACVEPVSNVPDAFNLAAADRAPHGAVWLAPGTSLTGTIRLVPQPSD